MTHRTHAALWFALTVVGIAAVFASAWGWLHTRPRVEPEFGVTFSSAYALELGFAPEEMYAAILDELRVRKVRLPFYWSVIEGEEGKFRWEIPDRLMAMSQARGVELTVVVGMKVPRWPECYIPTWAQARSAQAQHEATLAFIRAAIERYRSSPAVIRWQVENEPFFPYGECPTISPAQFQERVDLVRSLDDRPIQVTVSGEVGSWEDVAQTADVLGISMYRQTWNDLFGYFIYPLAPEFYFARASLVRDEVERIVVSELQAEPWFPEPQSSRETTAWYDAFTADMFEDNVQFVRDAGFPEAYLWGAEWWYALRAAGDNRLWEFAREVFRKDMKEDI